MRARVPPGVPLAVASIALALTAGLAGPRTAIAADASFGAPTAEATWGEGIEFVQPVTLGGAARRVEILLEFPDADGPVVDVPEADPREGQQTLRHSILVGEGHITPNTLITARWRVVGEDGSEVIGPPVSVLYEDTRFEWRVREGDLVRVHWHEGPDAFGDRALEIAELTVRETSELLGTTEEEPVDFFVYADQQAFYDAIGPGSRENVGGVAIPELRTLYGLIGPEQIDDEWVGIVIPHEMVHLVFDTATDNPYHFPPRWLNEGVAVYLSEGYTLTDRAQVQQAVDDGSLIPLEGLSGQFPTSAERFFLAYSESVSAVDYLVREHGRDAFVSLVRSYAEGLTDDEAFERAIGMDVTAFDAAWRGELGAGEPEIHGPVEPPAGPLPPGWTTAEGEPGASLPPASRPTAGPGAPASPTPPAADDDVAGGVLPLAIAAVAAVAVVALGIYVLVVRRRSERLHAAEAVAWAADDRAHAPDAPGAVTAAPSPRPLERTADVASPAAAPTVEPGPTPTGDKAPATPAPDSGAAVPDASDPSPGTSEAQPAADTRSTEGTPPAAEVASTPPPVPDYLPSGELWPSGWSTTEPPPSPDEPPPADRPPSP